MRPGNRLTQNPFSSLKLVGCLLAVAALLAACSPSGGATSPTSAPAKAAPATTAPAAPATSAPAAAAPTKSAAPAAASTPATSADGKLALMSDGFPKRPVVIQTLRPGSGHEFLGRILADKATRISPVRVDVQPDPGNAAQTELVGAFVKRSEAQDGQELTIMSDSPLTAIYTGQAAFKLEDVKMVMSYYKVPHYIIVKSDSPWKSFKDLAQAVAAQPGKYRVVLSSGAGTVPQAAAFQLSQLLKGNLLIIPSQNAAEAGQALLGGGADFTFSSSSSLTAMLKAGQVKVLATASEKRDADFPDAPTLKELGYDFSYENSAYLIVRSTTPDARVQWLYQLLSKAIDDDLKKQTAGRGYPISISTPQEATAAFARTAQSVKESMKGLGLIK